MTPDQEADLHTILDLLSELLTTAHEEARQEGLAKKRRRVHTVRILPLEPARIPPKSDTPRANMVTPVEPTRTNDTSWALRIMQGSRRTPTTPIERRSFDPERVRASAVPDLPDELGG